LYWREKWCYDRDFFTRHLSGVNVNFISRWSDWERRRSRSEKSGSDIGDRSGAAVGNRSFWFSPLDVGSSPDSKSCRSVGNERIPASVGRPEWSLDAAVAYIDEVRDAVEKLFENRILFCVLFGVVGDAFR
jgi:hypothetical protein